MPGNKTLRLAVIGDPIKHSLSPQMQNAALKAMNIEGSYNAVHVKLEELPHFIEKARRELDGFNITVPHKKAIIPFLDSISDEALAAESVNTVSIKNGRLHGDSTDGYGLSTAIYENFDLGIEDTKFCFIGCGGAAQAVASYMASHKAGKIFLINRTLSKAEELAKRIRDHTHSVNVLTSAIDNIQLINDFMKQSDIILQCTSLGLKEDDPPPLPLELINTSACIFETIYKKTPLLRFAGEHGMRFADGRDMLLHQGAKSLSIWTGQEAPVEAMRNALYAALRERGV